MATQRTQEEWAQLTRHHGRIRLSEAMAKDLNLILNNEYHRRLATFIERKESGADSTEVEVLRRRLYSADKIRKANYELLKEKGWIGD